MRPIHHLSLEAHQDVKQQCRPELPADCLFGVSQKVADLEGLFDLLEEDLDAPASLIEFAHGAGGPLNVVGDEDHHNVFLIDRDDHLDTTHHHRVLRLALRGLQHDEFIAQDLALGFAQELLAHGISHVVLGPGDPKDAPHAEVIKMGEVDVGLVKQGDFARLKIGTERRRTGVIVMLRLFDDGESWEKTLQVEAKMEFGGGLAAAVFGPIHATRYQGYGG